MIEAELNSEQCAKVALYMYSEWKKDIQPPSYRVLPFECWLKNIIERETNKE